MMKAPVVAFLPKKDTLSSQVTRYLLDLIARERLKAGDLAPSEVKICRELNVSRGIVREAYRSLATLGILEIESGKRPRVQGLSSSVLAQMVLRRQVNPSDTEHRGDDRRDMLIPATFAFPDERCHCRELHYGHQSLRGRWQLNRVLALMPCTFICDDIR